MTWTKLPPVVLALACFSLAGWAREDILVADFEGPDYGAWTADGAAFGSGPARGALEGQMPVSGFEGKGLVNSFLGGDGATGALTSPPFRIERKRLNFLIGGGMHPGKTCMNLMVDGREARSATGPNDRPGGSEELSWQSWDVSEFEGKEAVLQIVDNSADGWGHINVDQITQSDEPMDGGQSVTFRAEKRYLNLPVKNDAPMRRARLMRGEEILREFDIELAPENPDFWVFLDLSAFAGQELSLWVNAPAKRFGGLGRVFQDDAVRGMENLYKEKDRPQFHFSSRRGWNNDPNGLVWMDGEYHLYYQHNPYGWKWGNMHWGHAVSADLVRWRELPIAIYPRAHGDWVFSGSAVVDRDNTAGFKTGAEDVIVAAYTSTGRGECVAFSNDRGRTFTEYEGNPVVKHEGRDPKLVWYAPGGHWVMAVYDERGKSQGISFYTSPDLKQWEFQSRIEGWYECPELFEIAVDGGSGGKKWVVYAASGEYAVGAFDGKTFTPETGKIKYNHGNCFYASQTYSGIPAEDGRRIQIGWGTTGRKDMPFNQMMDFPVELTLRATAEGPRLFANPVREIETLRGPSHALDGTVFKKGETVLEQAGGDLFDITAGFDVSGARSFGFIVRGVPVTYDAKKGELSCGDKTAALEPENGRVSLRLLVDRQSVEIFGGGGRVYMPMAVTFREDAAPLAVFAGGGGVRAEALTVHELRSAWE